MKISPIDYEWMIVGREYMDDKIHGIWVAEERIPGGMVMRNVFSGVRLNATHDNCNLKFFDA